MIKPTISEVKRSQKESLLLREISKLFLQAVKDDSRLRDLSINRVSLSSDKGFLSIFFYTSKGETYFNEILDILKLYKPSLRKALASSIKGRYTPELVFKFDTKHEKQIKIESLLDKVKEEKSE